MKAKITDFSFTIEGKQKLTFELDSDFRKQYDKLKDHDVRVKVTRYRKRRSLDANAYAWVLMDKIAEATKVDKITVYRNAIREIGGVSDLVAVADHAVDKFRANWSAKGIGWQTDVLDSKDGYKRVIVYYGSSTYDSEQMGALIDSLVQDAEALGIETRAPEEIARIKSLWAKDGS